MRKAAGFWAIAASIRTTLVILVVLLALLVVSVVAPQRSGATVEAHDALVARGGVYRLLLADLELGHVPTSALFLVTLGAFFVNLTLVLGERTGSAIRRSRFAAPDERALASLLARGDRLEIQEDDGAGERGAGILGALGYRTVPVPGGVWGIKNRFAPLGFPLFHLSFYLLWIGGTLLYYTRHVSVLSGIEGEWVDTATAQVVRPAIAGGPGRMRFAIEQVDVRLQDGFPTELMARVALAEHRGAVGEARVNAPFVVGASTILVERAGVAPVVRLEDARGFTVERVAIAARGGEGGATGPVGPLRVTVRPIPIGAGFPERAALRTTDLELRVHSGDAELFSGVLRPGGYAELPSGRLVLEEIRYWVGLRLVHERGGVLLVTGFLIGVAGIVLRVQWFRREVAIVVAGPGVRVAGRAEFFPDRFRREMDAIAAELVRPRAGEARA